VYLPATKTPTYNVPFVCARTGAGLRRAARARARPGTRARHRWRESYCSVRTDRTRHDWPLPAEYVDIGYTVIQYTSHVRTVGATYRSIAYFFIYR
jgi:hypothetical protein